LRTFGPTREGWKRIHKKKLLTLPELMPFPYRQTSEYSCVENVMMLTPSQTKNREVDH